MIAATQAALVVVLLGIALAVTIVARAARVSYTLALVVVGLGLGFFHVPAGARLTPDLVLVLFLPVLLFAGAWSIDRSILRSEWRLVLFLALPGLVVAIAIAGGLIALGAGLPFPLALLLAAIVSPTDPVAVVALMTQLGMPARLRTIIEGESLLNDGVGAVAVTILLVVAGAAPPPSLPGGLVASTAILVVGGVLGGIAIGFAAARLLRFIKDPLAETTFTLFVAYGSYLLLNAVGASGILGVVFAGLVLARDDTRVGLTDDGRAAATNVWDALAFVANSLLFMLLGVQIGGASLARAAPVIAWAVIGVLVGRGALIALVSWLRRPVAPRLPRAWRSLLLFSGLRGALSLALALSLPERFPATAIIRQAVFGVVLVTLLGQGIGLRLWIPRLARQGAIHA